MYYFVQAYSSAQNQVNNFTNQHTYTEYVENDPFSSVYLHFIFSYRRGGFDKSIIPYSSFALNIIYTNFVVKMTMKHTFLLFKRLTRLELLLTLDSINVRNRIRP